MFYMKLYEKYHIISLNKKRDIANFDNYMPINELYSYVFDPVVCEKTSPFIRLMNDTAFLMVDIPLLIY